MTVGDRITFRQNTTHLSQEENKLGIINFHKKVNDWDPYCEKKYIQNVRTYFILMNETIKGTFATTKKNR